MNFARLRQHFALDPQRSAALIRELIDSRSP